MRCTYVGCTYIHNCYIFFLGWSFAYYVMSIFVSCNSHCFKVYFVWYNITTISFFWFPFVWNIFFYPLTFSLYVSLDLKWVSGRQHIYGSCFCIHSATLCLLFGAFSLFTCKVIIDMYVPTAILLSVLGFFGRGLFPLFSVLFSCDLMTIFNVKFGLLFVCVCVYLLDFFVCVYYEVLYRNLYLYIILKDFLFLNFKCIWDSLHLYSALLKTTVLILYFTSNSLAYPLTPYCRYKWFYYFCLFTLLPAL